MIPYRDNGIQLWVDLRYQHAEREGDLPDDEAEEERVRAHNISEYTKFMNEIWPKYLQVGLWEMSQKLNCRTISLEPEEFAEMPDSWCDNILPKTDPKTGKVSDKNDWRSVFSDFLREDILIETCRFFKLRAILELCEGANEIQFVTKKFKKEVLDEVDFEQIYKGMIKNLPGEKWQQEHTNSYLETSMENWTELQE